MGWRNPDVPWSEFERRLSDRPRPPEGDRPTGRSWPTDPPPGGDGGDSPAWSRKRGSYEAPALPRGQAVVPYAELHAHSNFSFLDGASHPEDLVEEAVRLGLEALALTDHDGFYGVVRFAEAAAAHSLPTVFGAELTLDAVAPANGVADPEGDHLLVLARDPEGYAWLGRLLSQAQMAGEKGAPRATTRDVADLVAAGARDHWVVLTGCRKGTVPRALVERGPAAAVAALSQLVEALGADNVFVELWDHGDPLDSARNDALVDVAARVGVEVVATNNVHYATPADRPLATAMAAVRARRSLDEIDGWLPASAGAHLRSGDEQARRFSRYPGVVEQAAALGRACAFDLALVAPSLPPFPCPPGHDEMSYLRHLTYQGARRKYGPPHPEHGGGGRGADRGAAAGAASEASLRGPNGLPGGESGARADQAGPDGAEVTRPARRGSDRGAAAGAASEASLRGPNGLPGGDGSARADQTSLRGLNGLPGGDSSARADQTSLRGPNGPPGGDGRDPYQQIEHELAMIDELGFPGYFLIVWDIVEFCRRHDIYCQGRGSAANSAVCYALGVTKADAVALDLLFERFLSPERDGPPDIDLDIESDRREEVIQYVYGRYGRDNAAQVANVITYRARSAVRDMAKALGFAPGQQDAWSKQIDRWGAVADADGQRDASGRVDHDIPPPVLDLAARIEDFPRHLGIHSGGMVICDRPIVEVCPVEWGRMEDRSVLQWDKDDCARVGLVKFDLLGLGMLSALHYAVDLVAEAEGTVIDLATIPQDDAVYEMLCRADTIGVFQVESRAQMATLPRLRPRTFYDLVVEVALIRPGPIQGGSVHPYIRRRNGTEPVTYLHPLLERSLSRTLGIPLFQEQLMSMAIDVAGFTAAEADELRQAMGSKRSHRRMEALRARFYRGMADRGVTGDVADQIWDKLAAFANFGFPESHSVSFAYLVYASAWIKRYHPAAFCAALLNAQPMGFYSPHSLVQDARRHGVEVHTPDLNASAALATLEWPQDPGARAGGAGTGLAPDGHRSLRSLAPKSSRRSGTDAPHPHHVDEGRGADRGDAAVRQEPDSLRGPNGRAEGHNSARADRAGPDGAEVTRPAGRGADQGDAAVRQQPDSLRGPNGRAEGHNSAQTDQPDTWGGTGPAVRLGIGSVRGIGDDLAEAIAAGRPYADMEDLARRTEVSLADLEALATAGAFACFTGADGRPLSRREALWAAGAVAQSRPDRLAGIVTGDQAPHLPGMAPDEEARADLWATGVAPDGHPTRFIRDDLDRLGVVPASGLAEVASGDKVRVAGVVTHRQRPATAGGTTFLNLEDETGLINVIVSKGCWARHRRVARGAAALLIRGRLEQNENVINVIAERIEPLAVTPTTPSRDFR